VFEAGGSVQDRIRINRWSKFRYHDPRTVLIALRELEIEVARSDLDERVKSLRTNKLKKHREFREAAVFCHALGFIQNKTIHFARCEEEGYDFIMLQPDGDRLLFSPLQIKELVPSALNVQSSLDEILAGLGRYASASDTVVAIHINRRMRMDLKTITLPDIPVGQIWLFGGADDVPMEFALYGDLCREPQLYQFALP
jgi:hypothetical protein